MESGIGFMTLAEGLGDDDRCGLLEAMDTSHMSV